MTTYEFDVQYDKLKKVHPRFYNKDFNRRAIFNAVRNMEFSWFKEIVQNVEANPHLRISIVQEVANYKASQRRIQETREIIHEYETHDKSKEAGLDNYLKELGAENAVDAISKRPKGQEEGS